MSSAAATEPVTAVATTVAPTYATASPARVGELCGLDLSGRTSFEALSKKTLEEAVLKVRAEFPDWDDRRVKKAIRKTLSRRVRNFKKANPGKVVKKEVVGEKVAVKKESKKSAKKSAKKEPVEKEAEEVDVEEPVKKDSKKWLAWKDMKKANPKVVVESQEEEEEEE